MALVVLLRGVNVGGHRTFRPSVLAKTLGFDAVSIGAAGTFVIRKPIARTKIRAEFVRRLPFDADVMICDGSEILRLASSDPFARQPSGPAILQFAGVMAKRKHLPSLPLIMPPAGAWSPENRQCPRPDYSGRVPPRNESDRVPRAARKDRRCAHHHAELEHNSHDRADPERRSYNGAGS